MWLVEQLLQSSACPESLDTATRRLHEELDNVRPALCINSSITPT